MKKSYILKFNETMGDYVIVEQETSQERLNFEKQEKSKASFLSLNLFKNLKKEQKNIEKTQNLQQNGFLSTLDNKLVKIEQDKKILEKDLQDLQDLRDDNVNIKEQENLPEQTTPTPQEPVSPSLPQQPQAPEKVTPQEPANPVNNRTSVNEGIDLLTQNYNNFRVLNNIYQNLRDVSQESSQNFSDFIVTNRQLQGGLLNIYFAVSGQSSPPRENLSTPILPREFENIVQIAIDFLTNMREINLKLKKLFMVESFDRQFDLIENSLSLQNDFLANLLVKNMAIKLNKNY